MLQQRRTKYFMQQDQNIKHHRSEHDSQIRRAIDFKNRMPQHGDSRIQPEQDSGVWRLPTRFSIENSSIPRILHQTFISEMVYQNYVPLIKSCLILNPGWKYYLWRDSDAEELISKHYPHFLQKYKSYKNNLERSDSIRYIVLHHLGGIYLDMDVECRCSFFPALSRLPAFIDQERMEQTNIVWGQPFSAMNSVMGSVPGHPFFKYLIDGKLSVKDTGFVVSSAGPILLTQKYKEYTRIEGVRPVAIMDPRVLSPLLSKNNNWKEKCKTQINPMAAQGCRTLASKNWSLDDSDNTTLAVHKFLHLGYEFAACDRGPKVNLTSIFSDRITFYR